MNKKNKSRGTVDRVEEDIVVVVVDDPDNPEESREVYIKKDSFKKRTPKEGDKVSVEL